MAFRARSGATLLALALTGCALTGCTLASATPPAVDVIDVHMVGFGLTEQQLAVTLCVTNPNGVALDFRRVTADLDISGAPLAAGQSDMAVRVPPLASTAVPFTVVTTVRNLGAQLMGVLETGRVSYRIHGTVTLTGALGITLPYSRAGQLDPVADGLRLVDGAADGSATPRPAPSRCAPATASVGGVAVPSDRHPQNAGSFGHSVGNGEAVLGATLRAG